MIKITAVSDTHKYYTRLPCSPCDIFIHAGDFDVNSSFEELYHFIKWIKTIKAETLIVVPGNHDCFIEDNLQLVEQLFKENKITMLINKMITVRGLKIYGSPYTPMFNSWAFMKHRGDEISKIWDNIPKCDILVTHGPALNILDKTVDGESVGCYDLKRAINRINPDYHIFGHIHHSHGFTVHKKTKCYNVSVLDDNYDLVNTPTVIEIKEKNE